MFFTIVFLLALVFGYLYRVRWYEQRKLLWATNLFIALLFSSCSFYDTYKVLKAGRGRRSEKQKKSSSCLLFTLICRSDLMNQFLSGIFIFVLSWEYMLKKTLYLMGTALLEKSTRFIFKYGVLPF